MLQRGESDCGPYKAGFEADGGAGCAVRRDSRAAQRQCRAGRYRRGAVAFGIGCTLAAVSPGYWWFAASLVLIGVAALTLTNTTNSMMQLSAEPAMRGRVMSLRLAVALGGTPIGAPIVGWVANHFGPRWGLGVGAGSGFTAALVAVVFLRRERKSLGG